MTKTKVILFASFALVFAAGVAFGLVLRQPERPRRRRSHLSSELDLSPEQREQMREIWSPVWRAWSEYRKRRRALQEERDVAVLELFNDDQVKRREELVAQYAEKLEQLSQEQKETSERAKERTREILTEEQWPKYEELMQRQRSRRSRPDRAGEQKADTTGHEEPYSGQ